MPWKSCNSAAASPRVLPLILVVINDADAMQIEHPLPVKLTASSLSAAGSIFTLNAKSRRRTSGCRR